MNREAFSKHEIFEKLELLQTTIADDQNREELEIDDQHFLQSVHDYISGRIKNTIPSLVQEADLTNVSNEINNGINQLNTYVGNNNIGHLTNAKNNFNSALNRVRNLPRPYPSDDFNFSSEIINFQTLVKENFDDLTIKVHEFQSTLETLQSQIEAREEELSGLEESIKNKLEELERLNSDFEIRFENDRSKYGVQFADDRKKFEDDANSTKIKLDKKLSEAEKIVNVIGNIGATGNFQKIANSHGKVANIWRLIALIFMGGFSGLLIWTLIDLGGSDFDWRKSIIRLIAAAALSYPATYAARESTKHRKLESYNRKIELELASIESFIEILDEGKKQSIKEKLAEKYFGSTLDQFEDADLKRDNDFSITSFERMINAISNLINKK